MSGIATVKVTGGPKGTLVINASELAEYRKKGYRLAAEEAPKVQTEPSNVDSVDEGAGQPNKGTKVRVRKTQRS